MMTLLHRLEGCLNELLEQHEQLLVLIRRKQDAMRTGDTQQIIDFCQEEEKLATRMRVADIRRRTLAMELCNVIGAEKSQDNLKFSTLLEYADEPDKSRMRELDAKLQDVVKAVKHETSVTRQVADALLKQMHELMQIVRGGGDPKTYGQRVESQAAALSWVATA